MNKTYRADYSGKFWIARAQNLTVLTRELQSHGFFASNDVAQLEMRRETKAKLLSVRIMIIDLLLV